MTGAYPVLHVGSFGSAGPAQPARPWARTFRGTPASVPEARRFVAEVLAGCPAREVLMTCVSELSANAIAHTGSGNGGVFIVEVDLPRPGVARIAVTDQGAPTSPSLPAAGRLDLMAEGGRGLAMVAACTSRWGYADAHLGRIVWAEACWPVPVPAPGPRLPRARSAPGPASANPGPHPPPGPRLPPGPHLPPSPPNPGRPPRGSAVSPASPGPARFRPTTGPPAPPPEPLPRRHRHDPATLTPRNGAQPFTITENGRRVTASKSVPSSADAPGCPEGVGAVTLLSGRVPLSLVAEAIVSWCAPTVPRQPPAVPRQPPPAPASPPPAPRRPCRPPPSPRRPRQPQAPHLRGGSDRRGRSGQR